MDWLQDDDVLKQALDIENVEPWKILVVDDDDSVHQVTQLAMKRFEFFNFIPVRGVHGVCVPRRRGHGLHVTSSVVMRRPLRFGRRRVPRASAAR